MELDLIIALVAYALVIGVWILHEVYLAKAIVNGARGEGRANPHRPHAHSDGSLMALSVVICVRDGADEIRELLHALKSQEFELKWEVVVVDDDSSDGTWEQLQAFEKNEEMPFDLQVIQIQDTRPGKKEALQLGVKQAKGDVLVFTDADCLPSGRHWLSHMMEAMNQGRGLVLGVSLPLLSRAPGLLGALQAWDALRIARNYIGWSQCGHPYMGVGRNMAVRSSMYPKTNAHLDLASGDDDLMVQQLLAAGHQQASVCLTRASQVDSKLPATASGWRNQKRRHWSTAPRYPMGNAFRLMLPQLLTVLGIVLGLLAAMLGSGDGVLHIVLWIVGIGMGSAWLVAFLTFRSIAKACQTPLRWLHLGWLQPFGACWVWMMAISMVFVRTKREW